MTINEPKGAAHVVTGVTELYTPFKRIEGAAFAVKDGRFAWVGEEQRLPAEYAAWPKVHAGGRGALPGLVDSHNHLVWNGSRVNEYVQRSLGATYLEIQRAGGGIMSTVRATRQASEERLFELAQERAAGFLKGGVTSLEIKSGYGLSAEHELRMLRVARRVSEEGKQRVSATLLAHLPDPDVNRERWLDEFLRETLPEVKRQGLAEAVDVFIEEGAFTLEEGRRILETALEHGLLIKAHAEQFTNSGAAKLVAELKGLSADHLEVANLSDLEALAEAGSVATLLPVAALLLKAPLPTATDLRAAGVKVAVATDHNPGSSPLFGLLPALRLALVTSGLNVTEALIAGTANAADALNKPGWGRIETGAHADYLLVNAKEALTPLYTWGKDSLHGVFIGGENALP